jgi:hypothetical protein
MITTTRITSNKNEIYGIEDLSEMFLLFREQYYYRLKNGRRILVGAKTAGPTCCMQHTLFLRKSSRLSGMWTACREVDRKRIQDFWKCRKHYLQFGTLMIDSAVAGAQGCLHTVGGFFDWRKGESPNASVRSYESKISEIPETTTSFL